MELIPFSQIDDYEEDTDKWTSAQLEAAGFLHKMDYEGGISGLLGYGGFHYFPEELHKVAEAAETALEQLHAAVNRWANERGVSY